MKTKKEKESILAIADELLSVSEDMVYYEGGTPKSRFTCIREAINYKTQKKSNKLSECMGRAHEEEKFNHLTKSWN